ncbi:MAG: hypothetical protein JWN61_3149, partial [Pseudonocardiales bacterium]|nr:hypothetical protein [Pseudonocardiales bacterium]
AAARPRGGGTIRAPAAMMRIQAMITICAPVEAVWAQLSDVGGYADWIPFIVSLEGRLALSARPTLHLSPPGARALTAPPDHQRR